MKITWHAGERFLERVFNYTTYTKKQIQQAITLLAKEVANIDRRGRKYVILPSFPQFLAVFEQNSLVTIIPK